MLLRRLLKILFGYFMAVAAATLAMIGAGIIIDFFSEPMSEIDWRGIAAVLVIYGSLVASFAAVPALVAVMIAEWLAIRSAFAHAFGGAIIGFLSTGTLGRVSPMLNPLGMPAQSLDGILYIVAAGIIAAMVYWLIAGRDAGAWRSSSKAAEKA